MRRGNGYMTALDSQSGLERYRQCCWGVASQSPPRLLTHHHALPAVLQMRVVASLSYASALESRQHSMLPAWQWPTWLMLLTWLVVHVYSFIRYNLYGETPWQHVTLWVSHCSQLPG
jgi:hypothetical protein